MRSNDGREYSFRAVCGGCGQVKCSPGSVCPPAKRANEELVSCAHLNESLLVLELWIVDFGWLPLHNCQMETRPPLILLLTVLTPTFRVSLSRVGPPVFAANLTDHFACAKTSQG